MAEGGVVVEVELGVDGHDLPVRVGLCGVGHDEGVDLGDGAVFVGVELGEGEHDFDGLADLLALEAELEGDLACLVGLEAEDRVDGGFDDGVGVVVCDLLDLDAALA